MKIRDYQWADFSRLQEIFKGRGLPQECMPDLAVQHKGELVLNPRFVVRKSVEGEDGKVAMFGFVKVTSEAFLIVDVNAEDPVWRWKALAEMTDEMAEEAKKKGLDCVTAWVPDNMVEKFGPHLEALGFQKSPWQSYSRLL